MTEKAELLFETNDVRGYTVSLSRSQYYNHIVSTVNHSPHSEFTPDEIKDCVEDPDEIVQSESVSSRDLYFGKKSAQFPSLYLKTVVAVDDEAKKGEVVTAHLTKHLSGGKDGGIRYVRSISKL